MFFWIITIILTIILSWVARRERRTLWFGALAVIWLGSVYGAILLTLAEIGGGEVNILLTIILLSPLLLMMLAPLLAILTLLFNGIRIIRREGFSLAHSLALGCGVGAILYLIFWPMFIRATENSWANQLFFFLSSCLVYFTFTFMMYFFATIANFVNFPRRNLDYIIVLGAGLMGDKVTPLLASRINKALKILAKQQDSCRLIMSGGQGDDELVSEAEAMAHYAIEKGVAPERVILEDKAVNTFENIELSYVLMATLQPKVAIVTNYYHLFRALVIARQQGYPCIGYGARTKFYYTLNAYLREYIGYLSLTFKRHLWICSGLFLLHLLALFI